MFVRTLLLALLALAAWSNGSIAQGTGGPLEIDGHAATRIVATHPGGDLGVVAGTMLYEYAQGAWDQRGTAVPAGQVASSGEDDGLVLAGDHPPCMMGGAAAPLQRSTDGGASWEEVAGAQDLRPLAIWTEPQVALSASCGGLQASRDGGVTWAPVPGIDPGWEITSFAEIEDAPGGPAVLVGLTGEGGTSFLRRVAFADPDAPVVSDDLRTYYAIGGLAARGDTYLLAVLDGLWVSEDAGATWTRHANGLENVVLEQDPATHGLPEEFDPESTGLFAVAFLPGELGGVLVGGIDGVYLGSAAFDHFTTVEGTSGRTEQIAVDASGTLALYRVGEAVYSVTLPE